MNSAALEERPPGRSSSQPSHLRSVPYVLPFVIFFALLLAADYLHQLFGEWEYLFRVIILALALFVFSRHVIDLRVRRIGITLAMGVAVFAIWVGPDVLIPGYREHWLFQNSITGSLRSTIPPDFRDNVLVLFFRAVRATLIVPVIEELFWRGWLMRWLIDADFERVPLGAYTRSSMWISALLFASEHGPYWEVGLIAGLAYNFLMVRTKSLGDCILAHAVTNGALCLFVIATGRWEYWY
jgi:CAAX prenyl protease-like protein